MAVEFSHSQSVQQICSKENRIRSSLMTRIRMVNSLPYFVRCSNEHSMPMLALKSFEKLFEQSDLPLVFDSRCFVCFQLLPMRNHRHQKRNLENELKNRKQRSTAKSLTWIRPIRFQISIVITRKDICSREIQIKNGGSLL